MPIATCTNRWLETRRSWTPTRHQAKFRGEHRPWSPRRAQRRQAFRIRSHGFEPRLETDADFAEAMNEACEKTRAAIASADAKEIASLHADFTSTWMLLMDEKDVYSANFIAVLQGLLQHTILESASDLTGPYLRAYQRIYNTLQGMNWTLVPEHPPRHSPADQAAHRSKESGRATSVDYYEILGVASDAGKDEIRTAYRQLALKWHPDVNRQKDAAAVFLDIRKAYDVLSNPTSRKLYDTYGVEGMENKSGAHAGDGNADRFWDEFKPFEKQSRKTKARNAGMERSSDAEETSEPQTGDIVEYPLSDLVKSELQDGREKGVGLLVGRNKDRGDAAKLPADLLGMCEIEPLRQEETDSNKWIPDEIGCSAFCELSLLKTIPVTSYDNRFDIWVIDAELSDGCGGPEIVEEIML